MRELTTRQKKILDIQAKNGVSSIDELPIEIWELLEKINDTEILYQNVNRYLNDKYWEVESKKGCEWLK